MISPADRIALGALALANAGVGLYLIGAALPQETAAGSVLHATVAVVAILLALPAAVAALADMLPPHADDGVLVNMGALAFMAAEVATTVGDPWRASGLAILIVAAVAGTGGLYVSLFLDRQRGVIP